MQKILFNKLLIPSVLDGTKTMTRRIAYDGEIFKPNWGGVFLEGKDKGKAYLCDGEGVMPKSKYAIGEVVAIAQSYEDCGMMYDAFGGEAGWRNPMFVKADFMPYQIQITDVKVERLQDISIFDTLREGIRAQYSHEVDMNVYDFANFKKPHHTPEEAFAELIDKVSGKGTWERNPWVFAYSFELACASFAQRQ